MFVYCCIKVVVPQTRAHMKKQDNVQGCLNCDCSDDAFTIRVYSAGHSISVLRTMEDAKQLSKFQSFRLRPNHIRIIKHRVLNLSYRIFTFKNLKHSRPR
jgi:hypothetical protein